MIIIHTTNFAHMSIFLLKIIIIIRYDRESHGGSASARQSFVSRYQQSSAYYYCDWKYASTGIDWGAHTIELERVFFILHDVPEEGSPIKVIKPFSGTFWSSAQAFITAPSFTQNTITSSTLQGGKGTGQRSLNK